MKKMGLGRGLDALLPDSDGASDSVLQIELTKIDRNKEQPRRVFDEAALNALADSIRTSGILSPLIVIQTGERYRIVAGERRFRAAHMAGLATVPCIVRDLSAQQEMEAALIENLQREDLNPIEEAAAVRALMNECGYTQDKAAQRLGKSRSALANTLRLLSLEEDMQEAVQNGALSAGHARVLVGIQDLAMRRALYDLTLRQGLSVRQLEQSAQAKKPAQREKKAPRSVAPELSDMTERLQAAVGVKSTLSGNEKRGKVVLHYQTREELELIYAALEVLEGGA